MDVMRFCDSQRSPSGDEVMKISFPAEAAPGGDVIRMCKTVKKPEVPEKLRGVKRGVGDVAR